MTAPYFTAAATNVLYQRWYQCWCIGTQLQNCTQPTTDLCFMRAGHSPKLQTHPQRNAHSIFQYQLIQPTQLAVSSTLATPGFATRLSGGYHLGYAHDYVRCRFVSWLCGASGGVWGRTGIPSAASAEPVTLSASITSSVGPLRFLLAAGTVPLQGVKDLRGEATASMVPLQEVRDLCKSEVCCPKGCPKGSTRV